LKSIRLNRYLASAGIASRRAAEELILAGRVAINGAVAVLTTPVMPGDQVTLDGEIVKPEAEKVYFLLNKPRGYVCSTKGDPRVLDLFTDVDYRLFTVGRLDKDTEGLLLVTNDGTFADEVIHPSKNVEKEYIVKADQEVTDEHLKTISAGTLVEGVHVAPIRISKIRNGTMRIVIGEGKKREVRHLLEAAGLQTLALKRVRLGSLVLGPIEVGAYRPLTEEERTRLLSGSNESEEVPSESLEFQPEEDHMISEEKAPRKFESGERRFSQERRPSPRGDRERGFGDRGSFRGERRSFQREEQGSRFGRREESRENRAPFARRERFQADGDHPRRDDAPRGFSRAPRNFDRPRSSFSNDRKEFGSFERAPREDRRESGFGGSWNRERPRGSDFGDRRREFSDRPQRSDRFSDRDAPRERREWTPRAPFAKDGEKEFGRPRFQDRKPFGEKKSFGDRKPFGDRPERSFGERKPFGERKSFGERPERSFGDRKPFGERKSFGDRKPFGERSERSFGERKPFGDRERKPFAPRFERGERDSFPRDRQFRSRDGESRGQREWQGERKGSFGRDRAPFQKSSFHEKEDA